MNVFLRTLIAAAVMVAGYFGARSFHKTRDFDRADGTAATTAERKAPSVPASEAERILANRAVGESLAFSMDGLRAIVADPVYLRRQGLLKRMFDAIPADRYAAVLAEISQADMATAELLPVFFASWRAKDLAAAAHGAEPLLTTAHAPIFRRGLSEWAAKDWAAAKAFAERLPPAEQKGALAMFERLDPNRAPTPAPTPLSPRERFWKTMDVQPHSISSRTPFEPILREWVLADPEGAAKEILGSPALRRYSDVLRVVYEAWKEKDAAAADRFLLGLSFDERRRTVAKIADDLATKDIAMARKTAELLSEPRERAYVLANVGEKLVKDDPSAAPEWLRFIAEADPDFVPMSLFAHWFNREPAAAARALVEHAGYQTFRKNHPGDALVSRFVDLLPFAEQHPDVAAQFVTTLPPGEGKDSLYNMAQKWAKKDGEAAMNWARSVPAGVTQDEALRQFTYSVAQHNAAEATKHLNTLPPGSAKSAAIEGFAFASFDLDPDAVLAWTRAIVDAEQRMDVLGRSWARWNGKNARAAKDWAQNVAELQPGEREALEEQGAF